MKQEPVSIDGLVSYFSERLFGLLTNNQQPHPVETAPASWAALVVR